MKRKGFMLVEIVLGFGLLGLLALIILNSITVSAKGISKIEKRAMLLDQCQRVVETLKVDNEVNNKLFMDLKVEGEYYDYTCDYIHGKINIFIKLDNKGEVLQTYTVKAKEDGVSVEIQATRVSQ